MAKIDLPGDVVTLPVADVTEKLKIFVENLNQLYEANAPIITSLLRKISCLTPQFDDVGLS
jgi:hypothetical protein